MKRGVASCRASCDVGQLFKPPKGPSDQAPATAWRPLPQKARKIRSERARHAAAPAQLALGRSVASCNVGQLFRPPKGSSDPAPATAWRPRRSSVQDTLPCRPHLCGERGVASCEVDQLFKPPKGPSDQAPATAWRPFAAESVQETQRAYKARCRAGTACFGGRCRFHATWASFSSRPRALQTQRRQRHGALAAVSVQDMLPRRHSLLWGAVSLHATWASFSIRPRALQTQHRQRHGALAAVSCARHAAVPSTGVWRAWSRIVRRGPAFQAAQGPVRPSARNGMAPFAAESAQDTQ